MMRGLALLTLLVTLDIIVTERKDCCHTIWRRKENVYQQGPAFAGSPPKISNLEACMATCCRAHKNCTAFEYRKENCWIHTTHIKAASLVKYNGTVQYYLDQKCDPDYCSPMWEEIGTAYPEGPRLSDYHRGHRDECLNMCATQDPGPSRPCTRVFFHSTSGGQSEPYGTKCTFEEEDYEKAPENCIEYRLIHKCL